MKKVFLINFSSRMLISVADALKAAGVEILYWQGYRDDFDDLDRSLYPQTVFHHAFDAIKNLPPRGISTESFEPLSRELVAALYESGWQAISMMGRADASGMSFVEKRNYYYRYLRFWNGMLKTLRPNAVIFSAVPHSATGFALYSLAKLLRITTIILNQLTVETRVLLMEDYKTDSLLLKQKSEEMRGRKVRLEELSPDLREYYEKHRREADATPEYKTLNAKGKAPFALPRLDVVSNHIRKGTVLPVLRSYLAMFLTKRKLHYIGPSIYGWQYRRLVKKWQRDIVRIRNEYNALQVEPRLASKFIYVPLAFQPEQTTCPRGGVFDDQLLMLEILSASLPDGYVLYAKEHSTQWYPHSIESHQYRYPGFYQRIARLPNTYLIPADISSFTLIAHASAVATVTGTAGWEGLLRQKPVLLFGYVWYMYSTGVFRVTDVASCREALLRIEGGYRVSEQEIVNFLAALDVVSLKVRDYKTRTFKERPGSTLAENAHVLSNGILDMLQHPLSP